MYLWHGNIFFLVRTVTAAIQKLPHYITTNHSPMSAIRSLLKKITDGEVYKRGTPLFTKHNLDRREARKTQESHLYSVCYLLKRSVALKQLALACKMC